jgi:putative ABC transport system substrate-binding protein
MDLLRDVVPGLARVAALVNVTTPAYDVVVWAELKTAADHAGVHVERFDLRSADELDDVFARAIASRPDALVDAQNPLLLPRRDRYAGLALQHRIPVMAQVRDYVAAGLLMSYGPNLPSTSRWAAAYVDKILQGVKPADLPVEQPIEFDFAVNTRTAQTLGLRIPPQVAAQVTEWID